MKKTSIPAMVCLFLLCAALGAAHPHIRKTLVVTLPGGQEATITYYTLPANLDHTGEAAVGSFLIPTPYPRINLAAEVKAGSVTIPKGEYLIGAFKNSDRDWTMALWPSRDDPAEKGPPKAIKLDSVFLADQGKVEHMLIDISPGVGILQGRAMLTMRFGSLFLGGALS